MILSVIFGFISGIALASVFHIGVGICLFGLFLAIIFYIYRYFISENEAHVLNIILVFIVGLLLGFGRMYVSDLYTKSHLDKYVNQKIEVVGVVVDEPDVREDNTKLTVKVEEVYDSNFSIPEKLSKTENVLITVPVYPEFHYGDKIKANITLHEPKAIDTDGRVFDYKGYLRVRGIWYTASFARVELLSSNHGAYIKTWLFKLKHLFTASIDRALPEPESSFMAGLLLGTKQSLGKEILSEFQRTGTSHVVVLSGYNIAIVAESIMALLVFLPKTLSFSFGVTSIILFTLLSGGGASAWRAAIMVLVALSAKKLNREYKANRALGFAVVLMLAPNPLLLVFDPSFQLSILATIGLIFVSPLVEPYMKKVPEKFGKYILLREIVSTTLATQIVVLPYLIYNTGIVSLVSLPVNILILGFIPLTMLFGFMTGIVGLVSLYLSFVPALFAYALLWYELFVVHVGASLPYGAIMLPAFSPAILFVVYFTIFISLYFIKKRNFI